MSIQPATHFNVSFTNSTSSHLTLSFEFYGKAAWIEDAGLSVQVPTDLIIYEHNALWRTLLPSCWGGVREIHDIQLAPGGSIPLHWTNAWDVRCVSIGQNRTTEKMRQTSYVINLDKTFWTSEPSPLRYSFIEQPDTGDHVLNYDNFAFDGSLITYEFRRTIETCSA